ncbi:MAG: hypothetical protein AAGD13_11335 [Pseudomonadota bacterium]
MPAPTPIASGLPTQVLSPLHAGENPAARANQSTRIDPTEKSGAGASGSSGENAATARRDGFDRNSGSGPFTNTGVRGTRGGEPGLLSRGPGVDASGAREARSERSGREAETISVREAVPARQRSVVERIMELDPSAKLSEIVERIEAPDSDQSRVKTERFMATLNEVRVADTPDPSPPVIDPAQDSAKPDDPVGRYDKTA